MAEKHYNNVESCGSCQETVADSVFSTSTIQQIINDFKSKLERNQIHLKGQLTFTVGASAVDVVFHSKAEKNNPIQHHVQQQQLEVSPEIYQHVSLEAKIMPSKTCFETQNSQVGTMLKCSSLINGPQTPAAVSNINLNFRKPVFLVSHNYFKSAPLDVITEFTKKQDQCRNTEEADRILSISEPQGIMHNSVSSTMLPAKFFAEREQKDFVKVDDLFSSSGDIAPSFAKHMPQTQSCKLLQHDPESSHHRLFKTDHLTMESEIFYGDNSALINEPPSKYTYSKQDLVFQELGDHMNTEQRDDCYSGNNLTKLDILTADSFLNKSIKHLSKPSVDKSNGNDKNTQVHHSSDNEDVMANSSQAVEGNASVTEMIRQTSKDSESCNDDKHLSLNGNSGDKRINEITDFESLKKSNITLNQLGKLSHSELVSILTDILQNIFPGDASHMASQMQGEHKVHTHQGQSMEKFSSLQQKEIVKSQPTADIKKEIDVICTKVSYEKKNSRRKRTNPTKINNVNQDLEKNDFSMPAISTKSPERNKKTKSFKMLLRGKRKLGNTVSKVSRSTKEKEFPEVCAITKPLKKRAIQHDHETVENEDDSIRKNKDMCLVKDQAKIIVNEAESQNKGNVSKHNRELNNTQESYACSECSKTFSKKVLFRRHLRSHSNGYQCDICGKTLKTKDSLYHHQRGLHTKDKPYKCKQCSATFNFHHSYKLHVQRHKGERPHKCQTCHKTYLTSNHLKVHTEAAHGVGSIICHICGKAFSYSCSLKQHLQKHSGERPFPCDKCSKSFPSKQSLRAHSTSHIDVKNFSCELCGKSYKSELTKNAHMKRHGKQQRQFMCELCGKAFLFKSSLQAHMNIHSKARPYACLTCGKAFKSKASLYTHKYVHRESQSFLCTLCGKAFKTKNCCAAHMKRHENDATYSCSQCGSTFPDKGGLSKHVKTIHVPKKHFMCKICGKKGTRGDNMRTHVKSHRNEVTETSNPVDFIVEEDLPVGNSGQGFVNIRPRLRGPKQQGSRRLYIKNVTDDSKDTNLTNEYHDVQTKAGITSTDNISKSELPALSTLQPSLLSLPLMEQAHYNTHLSYITDDDAYMQDISAGQISGLQSGGNHLHSHQDIELYPLDQSKASYYYIPQENELTVSDNNPTICYGPMASLLSAINPSLEQGKVISDSAYQNSLTALHAASRQESSLSISSVYSDTEQGNISKLQQMLNQESPMHSSNYLVDHLHTDPNLHERPDQDF